MTDPRKLDAEAAALLDAPLTLRERLGVYARNFVLGLVVILAIGGIASLFVSSPALVAMGYTAVFVGAVMLLAGGASGGGYANLGFGMMDRLVDAARRDGGVEVSREPAAGGRSSKKYDVSAEKPRRDPMERLRKGLRPEKNPTAFWTVIAGFVYIGVGTLLVLI